MSHPHVRPYQLFYTEEEGGEWKEWPEGEKCPIIDIEEDKVALTESQHITPHIHSLAWTIRWDRFNGFTGGLDITPIEKCPGAQEEREVPYATTRDFPARR